MREYKTPNTPKMLKGRMIKWAAGLMLLLGVLAAPQFWAGQGDRQAGIARADPNYFEARRIEAQAMEVFNRILTLWREEVYFELYAYGTQASRKRITQEAFAQRMVELGWIPSGEPNPKYFRPEYQFRTLVYIQVRIPYRNKFNPRSRFSKQQVLLLMKEEGIWRVDLVQLLRSPFA